MNPIIAQLMELAASASDNAVRDDSLAVEEQFPSLAAPLLRYEMLLKQVTDDTIRSHVVGMDRPTLILAKTSFDKDYLLSLPIPYSGIQLLCHSLLGLCSDFNVEPLKVWQDYADGAFNWQSDIDYMSSL